MKGLYSVGAKFGFQAGIPADVRAHFGGKKKFSCALHTGDRREAERLAAEAARHFEDRVLGLRRARLDGAVLDPKRQQQAVGYLFAIWLSKYRDDDLYLDDLATAIRNTLIEAQHGEHPPILRDIPLSGPQFEEVVEAVQSLLQGADQAGTQTGYARGRKDRPEASLNGAATIWASRASHVAKTKNQYLRDVREFTNWYELKRGPCWGAKLRRSQPAKAHFSGPRSSLSRPGLHGFDRGPGSAKVQSARSRFSGKANLCHRTDRKLPGQARDHRD
jgi:hypothetical protein